MRPRAVTIRRGMDNIKVGDTVLVSDNGWLIILMWFCTEPIAWSIHDVLEAGCAFVISYS